MPVKLGVVQLFFCFTCASMRKAVPFVMDGDSVTFWNWSPTVSDCQPELSPSSATARICMSAVPPQGSLRTQSEAEEKRVGQMERKRKINEERRDEEGNCKEKDEGKRRRAK